MKWYLDDGTEVTEEIAKELIENGLVKLCEITDEGIQRFEITDKGKQIGKIRYMEDWDTIPYERRDEILKLYGNALDEKDLKDKLKSLNNIELSWLQYQIDN